MKKAIVTGATGFIGSAFVQYLINQGVKVLALGRKHLDKINDEKRKRLDGALYINLDMSCILNLRSKIDSIGWESGSDCVFFNLAWSEGIVSQI